MECSLNKCDNCNYNCLAKNIINKYGVATYNNLKSQLIEIINSLNIKDLKINDLNLLNGEYVNLEYNLNNQKIKLLKDNNVYLCNQVEQKNSDRCYGIVADNEFILICSYGCNGVEPELILYKKLDL